jgi:hypothetical protein
VTSCNSTHRPPEFHQHSTRPWLILNPHPPCESDPGAGACHMAAREIKGQSAGRNLEQQWYADLSMYLGRKGTTTGSWKIADPSKKLNTGSPH